jgi:hypothetical protein
MAWYDAALTRRWQMNIDSRLAVVVALVFAGCGSGTPDAHTDAQVKEDFVKEIRRQYESVKATNPELAGQPPGNNVTLQRTNGEAIVVAGRHMYIVYGDVVPPLGSNTAAKLSIGRWKRDGRLTA